ncbi:hypothetical protein GCM10009576_074500 [Streptomyces rhizosphaericus]|uniref:Uncharacterized protein n=1 Tax=Streptomyces rhizosphaericus TaxID=114699 RepID=A0ABN1SK69_9ACTN
MNRARLFKRTQADTACYCRPQLQSRQGQPPRSMSAAGYSADGSRALELLLVDPDRGVSRPGVSTSLTPDGYELATAVDVVAERVRQAAPASRPAFLRPMPEAMAGD